MKEYIKPTFTLAGLFPVALAAGCTVIAKDADLEPYYERFGITDPDKAFTDVDGCEQKIPYDRVQYCKFTAVEDAKIFTSL